MGRAGAYGQALGDALQASKAQAFVSRSTLRKSEIAVTEIRCDVADNILTSPVVDEDAVMLMLQLRDWPKRNLWVDGKPVQAAPLSAGAISIFDLRREWVGHRVCPIHQLNFYLPRSALAAMAEIEGLPRPEHFNNDPLAGAEDQVISRLGAALLPAFRRPDEANRLFVDHITTAAAAHILRAYASDTAPPAPRQDMSRAQLSRAKERIASALDGDLSLTDLAIDDGMSISDFGASFTRLTGQPPHRFLIEARIADAMKQLRRSHRSLDEIAIASGFVDKVHLQRVFLAATGLTPGAWRDVVLH